MELQRRFSNSIITKYMKFCNLRNQSKDDLQIACDRDKGWSPRVFLSTGWNYNWGDGAVAIWQNGICQRSKKKKMRCIKSDSQGQKLRDYMEGESFYGDREHSLPDLFYQSHVPFEFSPSSFESFAEAPISTSEIKPCAAKECA